MEGGSTLYVNYVNTVAAESGEASTHPCAYPTLGRLAGLCFDSLHVEQKRTAAIEAESAQTSACLRRNRASCATILTQDSHRE